MLSIFGLRHWGTLQHRKSQHWKTRHVVEPRCNIWLEGDGALVMSDYRVRLLAAIHDTGSLAAAAQRMNLSFRRAWDKMRELKAKMGRLLVDSAVGGAQGGGSRLTVDGRALVQRYQEFAK